MTFSISHQLRKEEKYAGKGIPEISINVIKAILINHSMAHWATTQVQNGEVAAFRGSD